MRTLEDYKRAIGQFCVICGCFNRAGLFQLPEFWAQKIPSPKTGERPEVRPEVTGNVL